MKNIKIQIWSNFLSGRFLIQSIIIKNMLCVMWYGLRSPNCQQDGDGDARKGTVRERLWRETDWLHKNCVFNFYSIYFLRFSISKTTIWEFSPLSIPLIKIFFIYEKRMILSFQHFHSAIVMSRLMGDCVSLLLVLVEESYSI